jgi:hypothetical protein
MLVVDMAWVVDHLSVVGLPKRTSPLQAQVPPSSAHLSSVEKIRRDVFVVPV